MIFVKTVGTDYIYGMKALPKFYKGYALVSEEMFREHYKKLGMKAEDFILNF